MYSIDELVTAIVENNKYHLEFMDAMNGGDCDCADHITLNTIGNIMGWNKENV
jgi:hypothetical protein